MIFFRKLKTRFKFWAGQIKITPVDLNDDIETINKRDRKISPAEMACYKKIHNHQSTLWAVYDCGLDTYVRFYHRTDDINRRYTPTPYAIRLDNGWFVMSKFGAFEKLDPPRESAIVVMSRKDWNT